MTKTPIRIVFMLVLVSAVVTACTPTPQAPSPVPFLGITPQAVSPAPLLGISRYPAPAFWTITAPSDPPKYNPNRNDLWQVDLRSADLTRLDLSHSLSDLLFANFDTQTKWPAAEKMPADFDWQRILDLGKDPGLDIHSLHAMGIDGRNVGIAIIDLPMIVDHVEYGDQVRLYEEINIPSTEESEMHGPAVASIAVGKTTGVAPNADLYYIAAPPGDGFYESQDNFTYNFHYYAQAIQRVLEINQGLPSEHKIRVISISAGWTPDKKGAEEMDAAVQKAKDAGLLVVTSNLKQTYGYHFSGAGRDPLADPDQFTSYVPSMFFANDYYSNSNRFKDWLAVPMDTRTTAGPHGTQDYVFYRQGGASWSIPYIAGVYALAVQVKPSITPDEFWALASRTGRTIQLSHEGKTYSFGPILDPVGLMASLQQ
jgi:hypothetical protein